MNTSRWKGTIVIIHLSTINFCQLWINSNRAKEFRCKPRQEQIQGWEGKEEQEIESWSLLDKVCIEGTRVRLQDSLNGDYIHANIVTNKPLQNKFIASQVSQVRKMRSDYSFLSKQGPLEKTIPDFWRMVVQENVGYIFMLCEFTELAKEKCAK